MWRRHSPTPEELFIHTIRPQFESTQAAYNAHYRDSLIVSITYDKLARWWANWEAHGDYYSSRTAIQRRAKELRRQSARPSYLNRAMPIEAKEYVRQILIDDPALYLNEIQQLIEFRGWFFSLSTIWRCMTGDFGWTLRLYTERAKERDKERRERYRTYMKMFYDPAVFIFVDETSKAHNAKVFQNPETNTCFFNTHCL